MNYKNALDNLRRQVFTEEAVPEENRKPSFIPRQTLEQFEGPRVEKTTDRAVEWLRTIKSKTAKLMSEPSPSFEGKGGFAEGFAKGLQKELTQRAEAKKPDPEVKTPEQEKKDTFIRRRGDLPNPYAPMKSAPATFLEIMDKKEGGGDYDTLFGFSNRNVFGDVKVSQKTIGELKEFASKRGEGSYYQWAKDNMPKNTYAGKKGLGSTPMGRYQFIGSTLTQLAKEMGLSDDTVFTPEVQDQMFEYYLHKRLSSADTMEGKISAIRDAWEGFKSVPTEKLAKLISKYEAKA